MEIHRKSVCVVLAIAMVLSLAGLAQARDWRGGGVLDRVLESEGTVEISGKMYAIAPSLELRGPHGRRVAWLDLSDYQSEMVVYTRQYGHPLPVVTEIWVLAPSDDPDGLIDE